MSEGLTLPIAAGFGALAGMRSFSAPLAVARAARVKNVNLAGTPLSGIGSSTGAHIAGALALGELIADKLPFIPNRTDKASLAFRFVSGALAGATVVKARKGNWLAGALIGGSVAVATAYAAFELRKRAGLQAHIPDRLVALAEDGLVAGLGTLLVKALKTES